MVGSSNQLIKCAFGETATKMGRQSQDKRDVSKLLCLPVLSILPKKFIFMVHFG